MCLHFLQHEVQQEPLGGSDNVGRTHAKQSACCSRQKSGLLKKCKTTSATMTTLFPYNG